MNTKEFIILHHTGDTTHQKQFDKVDRYHKSLGWGMIGYQFFIEWSGEIRGGRPPDMRGAHTYNCGSQCTADKTGTERGTLNFRSLGVCLAGDFTQQEPSKEQIASLYDLTEQLKSEYEISGTKVFLHNETKATACPGIDLRQRLRFEFMERTMESRLTTRLIQARRALAWTTSRRRSRLERLIRRIMRILSPNPIST